MDTLCIPVGDGYDVQDLKLKAINLMAYIYLRAARVFVLESELSLIPLDLSTRTEIYAYILHSAWMKRCWTLQEGALAGNKCYFQMADGAMAPLDYLEPDIDEDFDSALKTDPFMAWRLQAGIDRLSISQALMVLPHVISSLYLKLRPHMLKEINVARKDISKFLHGKSSVVSLQVITGFQERVDKSIKYTLRQECGNALREKWTREFDKTTQGLLKPAYLADEFRNIWNTLRERSTTQADDLQAIFANLLNFNAYQITKLPSRERFNALVASMKVLPLSLLFIDDNQDPLLDLKTDGWIPTSLSSGSLAAGPPMEVREDFLRVEHDMEDWDDDYCLYIVQPSARASNQQMTLDFPDGVSTVTFKRPSPDAEHMNLSVGVGLLVNEKTGTGASVLIMRALTEVDSDGDAHKTQYYADYDCPITTEFTKRTLASRTDDEEAVQATGSDLDIRASNTASNNVRDTPVWFEEDSAHWELLISHSTSHYSSTTGISAQFLAQSLTYTTPDLQKAPKLNSHLYMGSNEGFSLLLAMVLMTFGVVDLPIIIFVIVSRIIIAVRLGWVDLSAIGRASLCLFPVQNLLASVTSAIVPFLVPISEILFIIDRSHHGFQRLEIAYLVCSFISVQLFWLVALATFEYLREQGYKVFLGSFANDSPDLGWFWSFYFRPNFVRKFTAKLKGL